LFISWVCFSLSLYLPPPLPTIILQVPS
jgi:hypothetical protein